MKKIKIFVIVLLIILISLIAFLGVFKFEKGVWNSSVPDYTYGMDIGGEREIRYEVDNSENEKYVYVDENGNVVGEVWKDGSSITAEDEESSTDSGQATGENSENEVPYSKETRIIKENADEVLTKENLENVKKIIQKRLNEQKISEYNIRIDQITGKLSIETGNKDDEVKKVENLIGQAGKFKIVDYQNGLVLMDNSDIKNANVVYSNNSGYNTYLQIEFNKLGAEKLKDISKKYVETVNETANNSENEETETKEETTKKYVSIVLDNTTMMTTYFGEEMNQGILQIPVGEATTDLEKFTEYHDSALVIANILNSGVLPITYKIETDNFVKSEITSEMINRIKIIIGIFIIAISIILIIKFKLKGLFVAILSIGYIALLSLVIRYTNVTITLNSFVGIICVVIMNYLLMNMLLKNSDCKDNVEFKEVMRKFFLNTIPVGVIAIVFTLSTGIRISSIGMGLFWGMILMTIYNILFTRTVLISMKNK